MAEVGLQDIQRALGRIEGKQEMMISQQKVLATQVESLDTRLKKTEQRSARIGGTAGGLFGVGIALVIEASKHVFQSGSP